MFFKHALVKHHTLLPSNHRHRHIRHHNHRLQTLLPTLPQNHRDHRNHPHRRDLFFSGNLSHRNVPRNCRNRILWHLRRSCPNRILRHVRKHFRNYHYRPNRHRLRIHFSLPPDRFFPGSLSLIFTAYFLSPTNIL